MIFVTSLAAAVAWQGGVATNSVQSPPVTAVPVRPPVIVPVAPPAPPSPIIATSDFASVYDRPTATVHLRASAGGAVLFEDRLRVGRTGATYSQNRSEAPEAECQTTYPVAVRNSFTVSVRPDGPSSDHYRVNLSWQRPTGGCDPQGNRGVTLDQSVELKPGQTVTVEGDAGVRVQLTRGR